MVYQISFPSIWLHPWIGCAGHQGNCLPCLPLCVLLPCYQLVVHHRLSELDSVLLDTHYQQMVEHRLHQVVQGLSTTTPREPTNTWDNSYQNSSSVCNDSCIDPYWQTSCTVSKCKNWELHREVTQYCLLKLLKCDNRVHIPFLVCWSDAAWCCTDSVVCTYHNWPPASCDKRCSSNKNNIVLGLRQ